ncbi:hypothetical protein D3C87_1808220 [compost metagenome]
MALRLQPLGRGVRHDVGRRQQRRERIPVQRGLAGIRRIDGERGGRALRGVAQERGAAAVAPAQHAQRALQAGFGEPLMDLFDAGQAALVLVVEHQAVAGHGGAPQRPLAIDAGPGGA